MHCTMYKNPALGDEKLLENTGVVGKNSGVVGKNPALGDEKLLENSSVVGKNPLLGAGVMFRCLETLICAIRRICRN